MPMSAPALSNSELSRQSSKDVISTFTCPRAPCRKMVHRNLKALRAGAIRIVEGGRGQSFGVSRDDDDLSVTLHVNDAVFYRRIVFGGSVGAGESYMDGQWTCNDLVKLVRILVRSVLGPYLLTG